MNLREVALLRLVAQGIVGPRRDEPAAAVRRMLALQAQELGSGLVSIAARSAEGASTSVESALNAGEVISTWVPRGTLHLLATSDLRWMLELRAPRALARVGGADELLGLTSSTVERAAALALERIAKDGPLTRAELSQTWRDGGLDTSEQRSYHLLRHLSLAGVLCLGPLRDGQQLVAGFEQWVPPTRSRDRSEALAELARRYFEGHGPATADDLRRWAALTAGETKAAVAQARRELAVLTVDGRELLLGASTQDELAACRREAGGAFVLPGFDELLFGYQDRSATLPAAYAGAVLTRNGRGHNSVIFGGTVVATWRRAKAAGEIEISDLAPYPPRIRSGVVSRAAELTRRAAGGG